MKDDVAEDEVGEAALQTDAAELILVGRINLKYKASCEKEGSDAGDESGQEGVEGESTDQTAVGQVHDDHVNEVSVD